jgi:Starch-binding associating with outer membrane
MKNRYIKMVTVAVFALFALSCTDFLDINKNPNAPTSASASQLLPSAQLAIAFAVDNGTGGLSAYTGSYIQHYVVRGNNNDNQPLNNDFAIGTSWANYFTNALPDLDVLINQETKNGNWPYVGIAQILRAYANSVLVDMWGSVPYFQATQGATTIYPTFDAGDLIYDDLFVQIDQGIANLAKGSTAVPPKADDLFYGGNLVQWRKFAKTLKLRLYNQIRLKKDVSTQVNALLTENDMIGSITDDFQMRFGTSITPENRNPGFNSEWAEGGARFYINPYLYELMKSIDTYGHGGLQFGVADPRIPYYFFNQLKTGQAPQNPCAYCPARTSTNFLSIFPFSFNIDPNEGFDQSRSRTLPGLYAVGGRYDDGNGGIASNISSLPAGRVTGPGTVPQRILTFFQRRYMEAELAIAGVTTGDARALLIAAMDASFAKVNEVAAIGSAPAISATAITNYKNAVLAKYDAASANGKLEIIMTQKWLANFGYSVDSWNDYRRTGYPRLHDGNADNVAVTVRKFDPVATLPYQLTDLVTYGPTRLTQRNIYTDKVFWAK